MTDYRYILDKKSKKFICPDCLKRKFVRYIDKSTGEYLPDQYGRCDREIGCSNHLNPYKDGYSQMIYEKERGHYKGNWKSATSQQKTPLPAKPISYIPFTKFKQSLKTKKDIDHIAETNNFVRYLTQLFGSEITAGLVSKYFIGTSKYQFKKWDYPNYTSEIGANVFWQIDIDGMIRSGKIMLYNPNTGKRIKNPFNHVTWVHTVIKQPEFELKQAFYGEHLLKNKVDPIAIVESEKSAIIASVYFPQFIWIAAGNLNGLNKEKCHVLKDRQVILYPDVSSPKPGNQTAFEKWSAKAIEFSNIANFTVNDLLERKASEAQRIEGCDIADFLIKFKPEDFAPKKIEVIEQILIKEPVIWKPKPLPVQVKNIKVFKAEKKTPTTWRNEVNELEKYFSLITIPDSKIKLNSFTTIGNIPLFIETHFETLKKQDGNKTFLPYLERLQELKQFLNK